MMPLLYFGNTPIQEEGINMQAEEPPVDRCGECPHCLWPDKRVMSGVCLVRRKQLAEEDPGRGFGLVMSSPQLLAVN